MHFSVCKCTEVTPVWLAPVNFVTYLSSLEISVDVCTHTLSVFISLANSSSDLHISFHYSLGILPKKCTLCNEQQIWADKISFDYKAHFTVSLSLDILASGLVRHAYGKETGSLLRIIICGICKGHLQEALDMTSSSSICMLWLLCGLNITDGFQTTGATGHFSVKAAKSYPHR